MTHKELVKKTAEVTNKALKDAGKNTISESTVGEVIKAEVQVVTDALKAKDKIQISGLGTFKVSKREARTGRNPLTGETITIAAKTAPKFQAGKALKDAVNA